ncbi:MAG TPA: LuxR family transcriptional regulator [Chloroflexi bacterium]|nr:LuxR family transcriptional regulator [Chloroflexota bacterium]HHW86244.1 LuxR family transcriptional regulator [Chloroflexota bacterium]
MTTPLLATKLYIPPPRPNAVNRPRLLARLHAGLHGRLTLVSAPAGFGKTTLVCAWVAQCGRPVAWLSLDAGDNDPTRFLAYLTAALQRVAPELGVGVLAALRSPQPPPLEALLTALVNELAALPTPALLVLDDYHVIEAAPVGDALAFLIEHLPPSLHLAIATREDPPLPLARLRARGQLTEVRAADLRFTVDEAAAFLNQAMGLDLSADAIAALETRTEGWIAGLQLAAISMQGHGDDRAAFIDSFTGSHRFVMDYLVEEVLAQQPVAVQTFLLRTSILERMCAPLCEAVVGEHATNGQEMLALLERANLFLVPLDSERRWYRYHHLFGDLLRQRLAASLTADHTVSAAMLHRRASQWYEASGFLLDAFQHAVAAHDIDRAAFLVEGNGMPLHFRGAVKPVLDWLTALPTHELDAHPNLWIAYASAQLFTGQLGEIEPKLRAAEALLPIDPADAETRDLIGRIASIRATVAVSQHQAETIVTQAQRALAYLRPENLPVRTATTWALGYAYELQGNRPAARRAYTAAVAAAEAIGHFIMHLMSMLGIAHMQEVDNQLHQAAASYRVALKLAGDPPLPAAAGAYLGLAQLHYQWHELSIAEEHARQSLLLARQLENTDRFIASEVMLARLMLARGEVAAAWVQLVATEQAAQRPHLLRMAPEIAAAQVDVLLRQGRLDAAGELAQRYALPFYLARVDLAKGEATAALAQLDALRADAEAKGWQDEVLRATVLQALAHQALGETEPALQRLAEALALAEPGGFIRLFVDEGASMAQLLTRAAARGIMPVYVDKLLAAFAAQSVVGHAAGGAVLPLAPHPSPLLEPLSQRELEVLQLIADGLSNHEIGARLHLALDTVKGHNRRIFEKLQVQRRTEAVAKARALGLLTQGAEG